MKQLTIVLLSILLLGTHVTHAASEPSPWAKEGVNALQVTEKFREEAFQEYQDTITREEFIYLAVRLFEIYNDQEIIIDESIEFTDTDDPYALKGATVGLTTGIGNNKFGPKELLTREQLATFMIRTLGIGQVKLNDDSGYRFSDDEAFSSWAKRNIYLAKANNIVDGVGNDRFNPKGTATVEQALLITHNILSNVDKSAWNYGGRTEIVEGVEFNSVEDVTEETVQVAAGYVKADVVKDLSQVAFDHLKFYKDDTTGKLMVKGYVPKAPSGFKTWMVIDVYYEEKVPYSIQNQWYGKGEDREYIKSLSSTTGYYHIATDMDPAYNFPCMRAIQEGEYFEEEILGTLDNSATRA